MTDLFVFSSCLTVGLQTEEYKKKFQEIADTFILI